MVQDVKERIASRNVYKKKKKSIQNILFKQEYSTPHYLWKRTAIPSPSSNPELLHFFLEPLVRRSTALMSAKLHADTHPVGDR